MPNRIPSMKSARPTGQDGRPKYPRESPSARGYDRDWQRCRLVKLADDPFCERCSHPGEEVAATEVDHILALSKGGTNERRNLRSLCKSCHSRKTMAEDSGIGR